MTYREPKLTSSDSSISVTYGTNTIDLTTGASPIYPPTPANNTSLLFEDFQFSSSYLTSSGSANEFKQSQFTASNVAWSSTSLRPGIITMTSQSSSADMGIGLVPSYIIGNGQIQLEWAVNIDTISGGGQTYKWFIGLNNEEPGTTQHEPTTGLYFSYTDTVNSGNLQICSANSSSYTRTNKSTAFTTGWHKYKIVINAAGSSVEYFYDGTSLGTVTTNLPATSIGPFFLFERTAGSSTITSLCDYCWLYAVLTAAR